MPKIKRYQNHGRLPPNTLHLLTKLGVDDELIIRDCNYIIDGLTLREMNIQYLPDVEQDGNALLCYEGSFYCWDGENWVLSE